MKNPAPSSQIEALLEDAYSIAEKYALFGVHKKVYKSSEPGFNDEDHNFAKYVRYSLGEQDYSRWIDQVLHTLDSLGLQKAKFRVKINEFNPETESDLPAHKFLRAIHELENLRDKQYLLSYQTTRQLPEVTFIKNTLAQGQKRHKFTPRYANLIRELWDGRQITNSKNDVIRVPKPLKQSMLFTRLNIEHDNLPNAAKAITRASDSSGIDVHLYYPTRSKEVFLTVKQDVIK